jgi:hypothetical protein
MFLTFIFKSPYSLLGLLMLLLLLMLLVRSD